ncbi:bromodomain-containing protein 8-like [Bufo gargarizans]|uniref:bromodomain-containing protein 8-like n=1 Tax=Bufo gargarizans TaxID=30331 RepID=UPI001CF149F5|nr:bromodomain-containing protein 8-like [Bufo gargarizans]
MQEGQTSNHAAICPMSSRQTHSDFEHVGIKQVIHEDVSDLAVQIELISLESESAVLSSDGYNSDVQSSSHGLSQVEDFRLSHSTMSKDNLLRSSEKSCIEDRSEGDEACLGSNLENNVEGQSHLEHGITENSEPTDTPQSSDLLLVIKEPILGCAQVEDPCQSTASEDDLLRCPEISCMESSSSGDGDFLGSKQENNVQSKSLLEIGKTEYQTIDTIQFSDNLLTESVVACTQDMDVAETNFNEPVSEVDSPPPMNQNNEISVFEHTECIMPKTTSMLELLLLSTREPNQKNIRKKLGSIWKMVADHRYAGPFRKPLTDREAPGYKEIVKRPTDLSTIKRGLIKGNIRTSADFQRDILLMFQNAVMYNSIYHTVHQKALEIQRDVEELLQVLNEQVTQSEKE